MRAKVLVLMLAAGAMLGSAGIAATERGTPAEAKALLRKAVEHYNAVGRRQALAEETDYKVLLDGFAACASSRGRY